MSTENKVALVTGASRGIGKAIAHGLAAKNFFVIGTATTTAGAEAITADYKNAQIQGVGLQLNVADSASIEALFTTIKNDFRMPAVLVNNAAITQDNLLLRMKDDEWDQVIDTNLNSVFRVSKACLRDMLKARWGRIINISSVVGSTGNPGQANYAAAKAGLIGFTKALAQEVGSREITVNAVAPGFIDTDMTKGLGDEQRSALLQRIPMQRLGTPEEIASIVVFLASPDASYITGQTLHVNGGMFMN